MLQNELDNQNVNPEFAHVWTKMSSYAHLLLITTSRDIYCHKNGENDIFRIMSDLAAKPKKQFTMWQPGKE